MGMQVLIAIQNIRFLAVHGGVGTGAFSDDTFDIKIKYYAGAWEYSHAPFTLRSSSRLISMPPLKGATRAYGEE